jgi:hypothetical protein
MGRRNYHKRRQNQNPRIVEILIQNKGNIFWFEQEIRQNLKFIKSETSKHLAVVVYYREKDKDTKGQKLEIATYYVFSDDHKEIYIANILAEIKKFFAKLESTGDMLIAALDKIKISNWTPARKRGWKI